jgi:hypothetical protein
VEFKTKEEAEKAIIKLNNLDIFPDSRAPLFVEQMQAGKSDKHTQAQMSEVFPQLNKLGLAQGQTYQVDAATESGRDQSADSPSSGSGFQTKTLTEEEEREKCLRSIYFARVPPCIPADEIQAVFATCGQVVEVNLYKPWASSKTSK